MSRLRLSCLTVGLQHTVFSYRFSTSHIKLFLSIQLHAIMFYDIDALYLGLPRFMTDQRYSAIIALNDTEIVVFTDLWESNCL